MITTDAGLLPAFMDYESIGASYKHLIEQFRTGRHVHAYLLAGPRGIGKRTYAKFLSSILFCEAAEKPCGICTQCRMMLEGKHNALQEITAEGKKNISVDRIREVIATASMHSLDGRERIILIEPVESMTVQAQNCLLKSLEEPDTNVVYFLLSHDTSSLLDTIISRCSEIKLTPWPNDLLAKRLLELGYPRNAVERAVILSGGNIGEALFILDEQPDSTQAEAVRQILEIANYSDSIRCSAALKDMSSSADQILFRLEQYLQQCMMIKTGLIDPEFLRETPWGKLIASAGLGDLIHLTDQIFSARKLIASNVNWQSNIDQLLLKILEAKDKWQKS